MNHTPRLAASLLALGLGALPCAAQTATPTSSPAAPSVDRLWIAVSGSETPLVEALVASAGLKASWTGLPCPGEPAEAADPREPDLAVVVADPAAPEGVVFARQPVGVYVHESNPLTRLTVAQLAAILAGDVTRWSELGGPDRPLSLVTWADGTHEPWLREQLGAPAGEGRSAVTVSSAAAMTATIARHPDALGFGPVGYTPGTRLLRVAPAAGRDALWPCHGSVGDGRYPLTRELAFRINGRPSEDTAGLVAHALSPAGADALRDAGACPASDARREQGLEWLADLTSPRPSPLTAVPFGPRVTPTGISAEVLAQDLARDAARLTADARLLSTAYAQASLARYLEAEAVTITDDP